MYFKLKHMRNRTKKHTPFSQTHEEKINDRRISEYNGIILLDLLPIPCLTLHSIVAESIFRVLFCTVLLFSYILSPSTVSSHLMYQNEMISSYCEIFLLALLFHFEISRKMLSA